MKTITILSGKGGVGKSSITASLAVAFSKDHDIICADCDVDASNLSLVLGAPRQEEWEDLSTNEKAVFDVERCISCKKCMEECYFNAIGWKDNKPYLKDFSCEGCGVCRLVCPIDAIAIREVNNAKIGYSVTEYGFKVVFAQLNIGESGSGKVVSMVRKKAAEPADGAEIMLIDSAAGVGCPVIASLTGSDFAILVTEPTPSGFSDMKKALELVRHFGIPCGVVINKSGINDDVASEIRAFANRAKLALLEEIPFDRSFAQALNRMLPIIETDERYRGTFMNLKRSVLENVQKA